MQVVRHTKSSLEITKFLIRRFSPFSSCCLLPLASNVFIVVLFSYSATVSICSTHNNNNKVFIFRGAEFQSLLNVYFYQNISGKFRDKEQKDTRSATCLHTGRGVLEKYAALVTRPERSSAQPPLVAFLGQLNPVYPRLTLLKYILVLSFHLRSGPPSNLFTVNLSIVL
jgi:hypothetical protein